jgi:hypothetical protein
MKDTSVPDEPPHALQAVHFQEAGYADAYAHDRTIYKSLLH